MSQLYLTNKKMIHYVNNTLNITRSVKAQWNRSSTILNGFIDWIIRGYNTWIHLWIHYLVRTDSYINYGMVGNTGNIDHDDLSFGKLCMQCHLPWKTKDILSPSVSYCSKIQYYKQTFTKITVTFSLRRCSNNFFFPLQIGCTKNFLSPNKIDISS